MDVFGKGTDEPSRPLLPPGTCWVCENSPQQEGMKVIDTRRNARAGGSMSHESVRKYVCEPCARELGAAVGMITPEEHEQILDVAEGRREAMLVQAQQLEEARASQTRVISIDAARELLVLPKKSPTATKKESSAG
jgi:hypothetical protein